MREVMMKAQELAEAILNSETYGKMKKLEGEVRHDETAARLLSDMIEKRQAVENILSSANMQPEELSRASLEMEEAEKAMNENEQIIALKSARKDFQTMMDNVNQILRLVITGRVDDGQPGGGCTGNCSSCGGCQ
jgi:cell fate (sporulation/competence/biofilm development) regulator YlbF (YheA/YmcA/DUF963 family)